MGNGNSAVDNVPMGKLGITCGEYKKGNEFAKNVINNIVKNTNTTKISHCAFKAMEEPNNNCHIVILSVNHCILVANLRNV